MKFAAALPFVVLVLKASCALGHAGHDHDIEARDLGAEPVEELFSREEVEEHLSREDVAEALFTRGDLDENELKAREVIAEYDELIARDALDEYDELRARDVLDKYEEVKARDVLESYHVRREEVLGEFCTRELLTEINERFQRRGDACSCNACATNA